MDADDLTKIIAVIGKLTTSSPFVAILIAVIVLVFLVSAVSKFIEACLKAWEAGASAVRQCFKLATGGRAHRQWLNRRKQFLNVLSSDLSAISKAEAWNDQHFTDLEAEVEIEGQYYAGVLQRILRRKSSGLRREPSLVDAIDQSSEKCLLLTGDPGAGKSVALRHLAMQMIDRSKHSKKEQSPVPLYINLREMDLSPAGPLSVDTIKRFVIDNVRRNDADTAEYLKENWDEFYRKGIWFFLFDSFDEIPAVMP